MKKLLAIALAVVLSLSMTGTIFAAPTNAGTTLSAYITGEAVYEHAYDWEIVKTVDKDYWEIFSGDIAAPEYTIALTKSDRPDSDVKYIKGVVTVKNGGAIPTTGLTITLNVTNPPSTTSQGTINVDISSCPTLASGEIHEYSYKINDSDINGGIKTGINYKITANVTITNHSKYIGKAFGPSPSCSNIYMPAEPNTLINDSVVLTDTNLPGFERTYTASDTYIYGLNFDSAGIYENIARIVGDDVDKVDNAVVTVVVKELLYNKETAWAYSPFAKTLNSLIGVEAEKWGWYLDAAEGTYDVYAGAGQNDITKGTLIGAVRVYIEDGYYKAEFTGINRNKVDNMQMGVYKSLEDLAATNGAPGQFTNNIPAENARYMTIHFDAEVVQH